MNDLIERLRAVQWEEADDCSRMPDDPTHKCVFVDMRPDDFRALLREAADALEAAREDAGKLRETLRAVSAVGIVQLFNTARDDVLAEFSLAELQEISRVTEHLRTAYVEHIYRAAWDAAIDRARKQEAKT